MRGLAEVSGLIRGLVRLRDLRGLSCFRRGVDRVVKFEGLELPELLERFERMDREERVERLDRGKRV